MQRKIVGIVSLIIGISMLIYNWFYYVTKENITETGSSKITSKQIQIAQWPPFIGVLLIVGGIGIVLSSKKQ